MRSRVKAFFFSLILVLAMTGTATMKAFYRPKKAGNFVNAILIPWVKRSVEPSV